jgi:hypothetical protein
MRVSRLAAPLSLGVMISFASAFAFTGCAGSDQTYRPYKGEPHPDPETKADPLLREDELAHGLPHEVSANTTYIEMSRKENTEVLEHVHRNTDGSNRNAWRAYEKDMVATLGPGILPRVAPDPNAKPPKDTPAPAVGGDDTKKDAGGDKPAGDDKGGDKPDKAMGGG